MCARRFKRTEKHLKAAYRLGQLDAITGHAATYDGYHAVMLDQGFDLDQAKAYFEGAELIWDEPIK